MKNRHHRYLVVRRARGSPRAPGAYRAYTSFKTRAAADRFVRSDPWDRVMYLTNEQRMNGVKGLAYS